MTDKATDVTVTQADEKRADDWAMMLGRMGGVILDQSQRRGLAAQFAAHRTAHSGEGRSKVTFVRCASCSGEFDEGEWDADTRCPECEQPKQWSERRTAILSPEGRSNGAGEDGSAIDEIAALRAEIERLREALVNEREENLWNAYNTGYVRDGKWHLCMSDSEWLARECGFNVSDCRFDDGAVRDAIPKAARNILRSLAQQQPD